MIKTEEEKGSNWYVFLVIELLLGAVLGYYASQKGWLGGGAVGVKLWAPGCDWNSVSNTCADRADGNWDTFISCMKSYPACGKVGGAYADLYGK